MHEISLTREFNHNQGNLSGNLLNICQMVVSNRKCSEVVIDFLPKVYNLSLAPKSLYIKKALKRKPFVVWDFAFCG